MMRWFCGSLLPALVAVAVSYGPAAAHVGVQQAVEPLGRPPGPQIMGQAGTDALLFPWIAISVLVVVAMLFHRRPRQAIALAIVLLLALFAFETGVHSVHHLSDRDGREACMVASAAGHIVGTPVDTALIAHQILPLLERLDYGSTPNPEVRTLAALSGRAPPLSA